MKKQIEIEYKSALEFIATYTKGNLKDERESLQEHCDMSITQIIAKVVDNDIDANLIKAFEDFAPEVGYICCSAHDIFYEYEKCPLCQLEELGIKMK